MTIKYPDLRSNPDQLRYRIGPGEERSETVRGHEKLLNRRLRELRKLEDAKNCTPMACIKGCKAMPRKKTDLQKAAGKLISAIQKEWGYVLGESNAEFSEKVMDAAHDLLKAGSVEKMRVLLGSLTVHQYIGEVWVQAHPRVRPAISVLEELLN